MRSSLERSIVQHGILLRWLNAGYYLGNEGAFTRLGTQFQSWALSIRLLAQTI